MAHAAPEAASNASEDTEDCGKLRRSSKLEQDYGDLIDSCRHSVRTADAALSLSCELHALAEQCAAKTNDLMSIDVASKVLTAAGKFKGLYAQHNTEQEQEIREYGKFSGEVSL